MVVDSSQQHSISALEKGSKPALCELCGHLQSQKEEGFWAMSVRHHLRHRLQRYHKYY